MLQHRNPDQVEAKVYAGFRERVEPGRGDFRGFKIAHPVVGVVRATGREVDRDQTAKVRIVDVSGQVWLGAEPGGETVGRVDGIALAAHGHLEVSSEGSAEVGFAHADEAGGRQDDGAGVGDPVNRVLTDLTGIQRTRAGVGRDVAQVFPDLHQPSLGVIVGEHGPVVEIHAQSGASILRDGFERLAFGGRQGEKLFNLNQCIQARDRQRVQVGLEGGRGPIEGGKVEFVGGRVALPVLDQLVTFLPVGHLGHGPEAFRRLPCLHRRAPSVSLRVPGVHETSKVFGNRLRDDVGILLATTAQYLRHLLDHLGEDQVVRGRFHLLPVDAIAEGRLHVVHEIGAEITEQAHVAVGEHGAGTMTAPSVIVAVELIIFALFQLGRGRFAASTILHAGFFLHRIRRGDGGLRDWICRLVDDIREDE